MPRHAVTRALLPRAADAPIMRAADARAAADALIRALAMMPAMLRDDVTRDTRFHDVFIDYRC